MAALAKTSYRINFTEAELEMVNTTCQQQSKYRAAVWFTELGWDEPERQAQWLHDSPAMIDVFEPEELKQFNEGKRSWDNVTYASVAESYLNTVAPILEKVEQIEWRYPCFAAADLEDQATYAKLMLELWPYMSQVRRNNILPNDFEAEWFGAGLRDFPMSVFQHNSVKVRTIN